MELEIQKVKEANRQAESQTKKDRKKNIAEKERQSDRHQGLEQAKTQSLTFFTDAMICEVAIITLARLRVSVASSMVRALTWICVVFVARIAYVPSCNDNNNNAECKIN